MLGEAYDSSIACVSNAQSCCTVSSSVRVSNHLVQEVVRPHPDRSNTGLPIHQQRRIQKVPRLPPLLITSA